ncbi:MAG: ABC transporter ATP-binding protein [Candidatus Rokubacteria bacterium]|nr:ABC transporter ATP-binding protein [Candidatus Rokubacteria bacterium]
MGVDLQIEPGERHAIIGPNGAGKTTLINLITGKYTPSRGRIWFGGMEITSVPAHGRVRLGIGRSFQIINLFPEMTVFENMRNAILSKEGIRLSVRRALKGLRGVTSETERVLALIGLESFRNVPAAELAYGKQRTLEIGLALGLDPQLLILDEPTAGISSAETREIAGVIRRVTERKTLILIEHDMDVVFALADRISVLHHGRILAQGSPAEIRENPEVKEAYLGHLEAVG